MPASTLSRYLPLLEVLFLIWFLPALSSNLSKRLVKSPKIHVCDSGLACHLCGADAERLADDSIMAGRLLESFVAGELLKQSSWTEHPVSLYHYRSQSGEEVDVVLEDRAGRVAAVEVKLAASVSSHDIKGLASLRDALGDRFVRGVVVYTGQEVMPIGDRIFAMPVGMLFESKGIVMNDTPIKCFYFLDRNCISDIRKYLRVTASDDINKDSDDYRELEKKISYLHKLDQHGNLVSSLLALMEGENSLTGLSSEGKRFNVIEDTQTIQNFFTKARTDSSTNRKLIEGFVGLDLRKQEWGFSKYVQLISNVWDQLAGKHFARKDRNAIVRGLIDEATNLKINYPTSIIVMALVAQIHGSAMAQNILKLDVKVTAPEDRLKVAENAVSDFTMVYRMLELWGQSISTGKNIPHRLVTFDKALRTFSLSVRPQRMVQEKSSMTVSNEITITPDLDMWFTKSQKGDKILFCKDMEKISLLRHIELFKPLHT